MRLIDADKLLVDVIESKQFVFQYEDMLNQDVTFQTVYKDLAEFINSQPTAYDIDKVVEQLERAKDEFSGGTLQEHYYWKGIETAIEIVKGGSDG